MTRIRMRDSDQYSNWKCASTASSDPNDGWSTGIAFYSRIHNLFNNRAGKTPPEQSDLVSFDTKVDFTPTIVSGILSRRPPCVLGPLSM